MSRPLMQRGIGQLEEMFAQGKTDTNLLKTLEHELQFRQTSRAETLRTQVQRALSNGAAAPPQTGPAARPPGEVNELATQPTPTPRPSPPPVVSEPKPTRPRPLTPPCPVVPLEDAYRVLKITPGSTWESIEKMRRTLVDLSHPSRWNALNTEQLAQALAEAKLVNAAYLSLAQSRRY